MGENELRNFSNKYEFFHILFSIPIRINTYTVKERGNFASFSRKEPSIFSSDNRYFIDFITSAS